VTEQVAEPSAEVTAPASKAPREEDPAELRKRADEALEAGDALAAETALRELWALAPGHASAAFVVPRFERLREALPLQGSKVAILRSFTVEPVVPLLRATAFAHRLDLEVRLGEFNAYAQELLDPESKVYAFAPDAVLLAVQARDLVPRLWEDFADLDGDAVTAAVDDASALLRSLAGAFRGAQGTLVLHTLEAPGVPSRGLLDSQAARSQAEAIRQINRTIAELAESERHVVVLDYDALVARRGRDRWFDRRKWLTTRMPIAAGEQVHLAYEWAGCLHALAGKVCKAIAVDLDNTLWGGVVGEDGVDGLQLDGEYPGAAFREVQRALLDLHQRGVLLAVCSKNNPAESLEALERHPGMLLRREHFSVLKINWQDKATNLLEIAAELNIGIDAVGFLDDNPVERELVRRQLPDVTIVDLPRDPLGFAEAIRRSPVFERVSLTDEDRARGRYYAEQGQRRRLEQSAGSVEDFLSSLEMRVEIAPVTPATLPRTAQLTQKTNQFNLTTLRYTEAEIEELRSSAASDVLTLKVVDRFGDNGLVGVAILHFDGEVCEIDSLLMSCRVIGRTIETAFLAAVVGEARKAGARRLSGRFVPTAKNAPAREFYSSHGFAGADVEDGSSVWDLDLDTQTVACPAWIELTIVDAGSRNGAG
jgi:FkbH-like protein